jgi:membrane-bound ClpP family serine protease
LTSVYVALIAVPAFFILAIIAASRHKKLSGAPLKIVGAVGVVVEKLHPEGFIIVNGESWPSVSFNGLTIEVGEKVVIAGVNGVRLSVRPTFHY